MPIPAFLLVLFSLLLGGCAGLEPAQPPDLNIPDSHLFGVTRLAFDPAGERIASAGFKGDLALWSVPSGSLVGRFDWHRTPVRGLVWIDHAHLMSADESGDIVITPLADTSSALRHRTVTGLTALAYLDQANVIVAGYEDGQISVFEYPGMKVRKQINIGSGVIALATDHAGRQLAVSTEDRRVLLMDQMLAEVHRLESPPRTALELRFSPDDQELVAGAWYNLFYWSLNSGRLRIQETEHWGAVTSIDYHPDGKRVISLGRHTDANLRLVTVDEGKVLRRLQGHRLCGAAVRISPDGRFIASGSDDESIRLYDLNRPYRPQRVGDNW